MSNYGYYSRNVQMQNKIMYTDLIEYANIETWTTGWSHLSGTHLKNCNTVSFWSTESWTDTPDMIATSHTSFTPHGPNISTHPKNTIEPLLSHCSDVCMRTLNTVHFKHLTKHCISPHACRQGLHHSGKWLTGEQKRLSVRTFPPRLMKRTLLK